MTRLLPTTWPLGDVADVEKVCRSVLDDQLRKYGARLRPDDHDDAVAYLLGEAWTAHERYDRTKGATFRTWLFLTLERRVADWFRQHLGRGQRRAIPVSLDDLDPGEADQRLSTIDADLEAITAPEQIDLAALSPGALLLARALSTDEPAAAVARRLGMTVKQVGAERRRLEEELRCLTPAA